MADKKINDLTALTTADSTDMLEIVDVSANTNKKVTVNGLVAPAAITTTKVADDAITDAKLINGKVYRRQGSSPTDWSTVGTNTYDVSASDVKIQTGRVFNNASPNTITFPVAFTQVPTVIASVVSVNTTSCFAIATGASTTGVSVQVYDNAGAINNSQDIAWIAIGQ